MGGGYQSSEDYFSDLYKVVSLSEDQNQSESECDHLEVEKLVIESFTYLGSALGSFEVKNAKVLRCEGCGEVNYLRLQSQSWEIEKAKELRDRGGPYVGKEVTFLWQVTGLSLNQFADAIHLTSNVYESSRIIESWENSSVPVEFEGLFLKTINIYLRKEEIINDYFKELYKKTGF